MLSEQRILVTGGSGFIGSNLVSALTDLGCSHIYVCDTLGTGGKWLNMRKCFVRRYIRPEALPAWLNEGREIDLVVHLGANSSTMANDGDEVLASNFQFSNDLLDWCTHKRVRLIYASSAATYGDGSLGFRDDFRFEHLRKLRPLNLYGWSKNAFDLVVANKRERGEPLPPLCLGLKFFNVYGPNEYYKGEMRSVVAKFFDSATKDKPVSLFKSYNSDFRDGEQKRDFVYVRDVVDILLWLAGWREGVDLINIGSGEAKTFLDLTRALFKAVGRDMRVEFVDMPDKLRHIYQYSTVADISKLRLLGYSAAMTSLDEGVSDYVRNYLLQADPHR